MVIQNKQEKLLTLLEETINSVPYYYDHKDAEITDFPFLTKSKMKEDIGLFLNHNLKNREQIMTSLLNPMEIKNYIIEKEIADGIYLEWTTGSSGVPFKCIKTTRERNIISFNMWKRRRRIDTSFIPSNFFALIHTGDKGIPFDIRDYSEKNLKELYSYLKKELYSFLHTTPTLLKRHVIDSGVDQSLFYNSVKCIESTGSFLDIEDKQFFEKIFNAKIVDSYGLIEVWSTAYTCKNGHYHVNSDNIFFELIDTDWKVIYEKNKVGQIAVTSLNQFAMPFIRYLTGDFAQYLDVECDCGEPGPIISLEKNRMIHLLHTKNGLVDGPKFVKKMLKYVFWQNEFPDISFICLVQEEHIFTFYLNQIQNTSLFELLMKEAMNKEMLDESKVVFQYVSLQYYEEINKKNYLFINRSKNSKSR